jgi:hypothetical protein
MAQTTSISQQELKRVAGLAYEGKTLYVMLCSLGVSGLTAESTVTAWQGVEQSGNGYVRYSTTIGTGAYNAVAGKYVLPDIDAAFTATSTGYTYDRVVLYIQGATYPYAVIAEDPNIALSAGQTQTYRLSLNADD